MIKILKNINKRLGSLIFKIEEKDLSDKDKLRYHANSILEIVKGDHGDIQVIHIWDFEGCSKLEWSIGNCFTEIELKVDGKEDK